MEKNPFVQWVVKNLPDNVKKKTFFIPDDKVLGAIYKKFGTTEEQILSLTESGRLVYAFFRLWDEANFKENGIKFDGKTVDGIKLSGKSKQIGSITIRYINGFLSKPNLTQGLKYALNPESAVQKESHLFGIHYENARGGITRIALHPDLLAGLLGIPNILDLEIPVTDRLIHWSEVEIDQHGYNIIISGEACPIIHSYTDPNEKIRTTLVTKLPASIIKKLRNRVEQLKNAQGLLPKLYKDLLGKIAEGNLVGQDLISFCNTHPEINAYCNSDDQSLFKRLLRQEFAIDWETENHGMSPRDLYKEFYTHNFVAITKGEDQGEVTYSVSDGPEVTKVFINLVDEPSNYLDQFIFFFPDVPEFSFYVEISTKLFVARAGNAHLTRDIVRILDSKVIEQHLSRTKLNSFILTATRGLDPREQTITLPDVMIAENEDLSWYQDYAGAENQGIWIFKEDFTKEDE